MIIEAFKTKAEAEAKEAEVESKGAVFTSVYQNKKGWVVAWAWEEEDATFKTKYYRWTEGKDRFGVLVDGDKVEDLMKNGRSLPARAHYQERHMMQEYKERF